MSLCCITLGGSVPVFDEVVISLARMKDIVNLDVEAGMFTDHSGKPFLFFDSRSIGVSVRMCLGVPRQHSVRPFFNDALGLGSKGQVRNSSLQFLIA